ncbi:MAG: DMT family transporter [Spirochaetota bacterium]
MSLQPLSMLRDPALAITLALVGNALLSLGMVLQKRHIAFLGGSPRSPNDKERIQRRDRLGWISGFAIVNSAPVFNYLALLGLSPNVVAAVIGSNVAFTALFSRLLLKEAISPRTFVLSLFLFAAIGLAGFRGSAPGAGPAASEGLVYFFLALPVLAALVTLALRRRRRSEGLAVAIGGIAGALGGFSILPMKLLGAQAEQNFASWLLHPWLWLYLLASASSFAIVQLAYKDGRMGRVAPAFYGLQVLWPAVASLSVFGLPFDPLQWLAFAAIALSVALISGGGAGGGRRRRGAGGGARGGPTDSPAPGAASGPTAGSSQAGSWRPAPPIHDRSST